MYYTSYSDFLNFIDSFILEVEEFEKRQEAPKLPRPRPKIIILIINEGTPFPSGRSPPFFSPGRGYNFVITIDILQQLCYNNIVIKRERREKDGH